MIRIVWTSEADADLRRIDEWLLEKSTPEIAVRTLVAIKQRADFLLNSPRGARPLGPPDYRLLRVFHTPFLIAYRVMKNDQVEILRVFHEREDWHLEP
jgi:plasmid stabilization system protein ParE